MTPPHYVITGGPCAGKTTTIEELKARSYTVVPESARTVIAAELASGSTIEKLLAEPVRFEHLILAHQLELAAGLSREDTAFYDRGIPDNVAYYRKFGLPFDDVLKEAIAAVRYRKVFLLEMLDFAGDSERYETSSEEAAELHALIERAYVEMGYEIVPVPVMPITDRVDFILERID